MLVFIQVAIGKKAPKHNNHPKVQLHRQDNWKVAHEFMKSAGINVKGIEPAGIYVHVCTKLILCAPLQCMKVRRLYVAYYYISI